MELSLHMIIYLSHILLFMSSQKVLEKRGLKWVEKNPSLAPDANEKWITVILSLKFIVWRAECF